MVLCTLLSHFSTDADAESKHTTNLLESVCPQHVLSKTRRRPGVSPRLNYQNPKCRSDRLASPTPDEFKDPTRVTDRWRIVETLGYPVNWLDPYHGSNPLGGDRPVFGKDWFIDLGVLSSTGLQLNRLPIVKRSSNNQGVASESVIRTGEQFLLNQNFVFDTVLYKGDTVFRPPEFQFRFTPVINYNQRRSDAELNESSFFTVRALYIEKYLRDVSDHYDFDSVRIGIQPFTSDFRGFLLLDQQLGVRLFGTRDNNIFQYNLAWLRRFHKNVNNKNDLERDLPDNDVFLANLYWQDLFKAGFTSEFLVAYNRSRVQGTRIITDESNRARPATFKKNVQHDYDVVYLGYNGDGHFGRINLTGSLYYAVGTESKGTFVDSSTAVSAFFTAGEISMDFDWLRLRVSALHASGDDNPFDHTAHGFDGIFQNPVFAGTNFGFYNHQQLPLPGNTISLKRNNAFFNSLRSQADTGQSNFTNPGINLIGLGVDLDLLPELRIALEANQLWFDETAVLDAVMGKQGIASNIGQDLSMTAIYRPFTSQNVIFSFAAATLIPGQGYQDVYDDRLPYSIFANIILTY